MIYGDRVVVTDRFTHMQLHAGAMWYQSSSKADCTPACPYLFYLPLLVCYLSVKIPGKKLLRTLGQAFQIQIHVFKIPVVINIGLEVFRSDHDPP
eukprot:sb/3479285/